MPRATVRHKHRRMPPRYRQQLRTVGAGNAGIVGLEVQAPEVRDVGRATRAKQISERRCDVSGADRRSTNSVSILDGTTALNFSVAGTPHSEDIPPCLHPLPLCRPSCDKSTAHLPVSGSLPPDGSCLPKATEPSCLPGTPPRNTTAAIRPASTSRKPAAARSGPTSDPLARRLAAPSPARTARKPAAPTRPFGATSSTP